MTLVSQKLRASARGQKCQFQIPGYCDFGTETVVLCHCSASERKGMGNKADDIHAVFGCANCHEALDQHRLDRASENYYWLRGIMRTQVIWLESGLLAVAAEKERKVRPLNKIVARPEKFRR